MKNLMTQKLLFGMLMALVLAFGVVGVVDAIEKDSIAIGATQDLATIAVNSGSFNVTLSLTLDDPVDRNNSSNQRVTQDGRTRIDSTGRKVFDATNGTAYRLSSAANARLTTGTRVILTNGAQPITSDLGEQARTASGTLYVDDSNNVFDRNGMEVYIRTGLGTADSNYAYARAIAAPDDPVDTSLQQYYNEQVIKIDIPSGIILTSHPVSDSNGILKHSDVTLTQSVTETDGTKFPLAGSDTITVNVAGYATSVGEKTFTISDVTPSADRPSGETAATSLTFTIYVTESDPNRIPDTTSITLRGLRNGYSAGNFGNNPVLIYSGSSNYPVTYTVNGGGSLHIQKTFDRKTTLSTAPLTTSSAATVYLTFPTSAATQTVTAAVTGGRTSTGVYIYGFPTLEVGYPSGGANDNIDGTMDNDGASNEGTEGNGGAVGSTLTDAITAKVADGVTPTAGNVQGVIVKFEAKGGTYDGGNLIFSAGTLVNRNGIEEPGLSNSGKILYVLTDSNGEAKVNFRFGEAPEQKVVVTAAGFSREVSLFAKAVGTGKRLSAERITSSGGKSNLRAIVRDADGVVEDEQVRFRITTGAGVLDDTPATVIDNPVVDETFALVTGATEDADGMAGATVYDATDENGVAHVIFTPDATYSGSVRITASIADADGNVVDSVDFNVRGGTNNNNQRNVDPYLSISVSPTNAAAGASGRVTVNAFDSNEASEPNVPVTLRATGITFSPNPVSSGSSATFTFPSSGTRTITATASNYTTDTATITVTQPRQTTPTLSLSSSTISGAAGSTQSITATVLQSNGSPAPGIAVTLRLGNLSPVILSTNTSGQVSHTFILPSTATTLSVSANVLGTSLSESVSISVTGTTTTTTGTTTTTTTTTPEPEPVSLPSQLSIPGSSSLDGEINRRLANPLRVRVLDDNNAGVSAETVFFSIAEGSGRLSPARTRTDADGYAEVGFTPQSSGTIEIEVTSGTLDPVSFTITTGEPPDAITVVSGNNQSGRPGAALANPFVVEVIDENDDPVPDVTVTFAVTAGGGTLSETSVDTNNNGRAQTTLTLGSEPGDNTVAARVTGITGVTFTATSGAEVHVDASERVPIYWINGSTETLHRLVDAETENLASNVSGIKSLAIDSANDHLYWGVQVSRGNAQIRRSNLDGTAVRTIRTLTSAPSSIAIDSAGGMVYWANNASGKIKRSSITGGNAKVTAIVQGLSNPTAITLSNGYLYWAEATGGISRMSLTAEEKTVETIATGLGEPLSIAITRGMIYWVESDVAGGGALQRADVDGTGNVEEVRVFAGNAPNAIAIDGVNRRLYWTKTQGRIQRANLTGRNATDIVTGLMNPGGIALVTAQADDEPADDPAPPRSQSGQPAAPTYTKYDINRDGAVNSADTKLVAGAVGQSGDAITNPRTDVDDSGTVDVTDLILVIGNLDDDAAAPAIDVDLTAMDLDFDRVQEQVEMLLASGDRSIAAQRALMYLQHLLASARPHETVLLANYPNPFNPETWIPYHLADSTDVQINIYNAQGTLVRALTLGHQTAGYYTSRSRAAYWDGRNALGERVASGIYFYQLQTDEVSPMRKMVILK